MNFETLESLFDEFLRERKYLKNISLNTEKFYRQAWTAFKKYSTKQLTQTDLNKWIVAMREAEIKPKSCNTFISAINAFIHWLFDSEVIEKRLTMKLIKLEETPVETATDKQLQEIINFRPKGGELRTHTILLLLIDTGIRIDEALGCLVKDINFDESLITIKGKGNKVRTIPMSKEMREKLWLWKKKKHESPFLFPTNSGNRMNYNNFRRDLQVVKKRLGMQDVR